MGGRVGPSDEVPSKVNRSGEKDTSWSRSITITNIHAPTATTTTYLPYRSSTTYWADMLGEVVLIAKEMNVTTERWLMSTYSIAILPYWFYYIIP